MKVLRNFEKVKNVSCPEKFNGYDLVAKSLKIFNLRHQIVSLFVKVGVGADH